MTFSSGAITESDVTLASASSAIIIGFNVRPDATAKGHLRFSLSSGYFHHNISFNNIKLLHLVKTFEYKTALKACFYFFYIVFKTFGKMYSWRRRRNYGIRCFLSIGIFRNYYWV